MSDKLIRINKFLSLCGVTSRRGADSLIAEGRVTVNNKTVDKPGMMIDEVGDLVKVDGSEVKPVEHKAYVLLNKPKKVMTTLFDPFRRKTILHFLKNLPIRVYPIGRLDFDTDGVLLLTNDGDLAYRLAHPRYQVEKIYEVVVRGQFSLESAAEIKKGIKLEDGATGKAETVILGRTQHSTRLRMTLREGRKREVKQLCKLVGNPVEKLRRVEFAGIACGTLKPGKWRYLKPDEIDSLKNKVDL